MGFKYSIQRWISEYGYEGLEEGWIVEKTFISLVECLIELRRLRKYYPNETYRWIREI